jgi:hypothetical protein
MDGWMEVELCVSCAGKEREGEEGKGREREIR